MLETIAAAWEDEAGYWESEAEFLLSQAEHWKDEAEHWEQEGYPLRYDLAINRARNAEVYKKLFAARSAVVSVAKNGAREHAERLQTLARGLRDIQY